MSIPANLFLLFLVSRFEFKWMRTVGLADGSFVPALGQGTWRMGEDNRERATEIAALRLGIELGISLIDTAEMYARAERRK